MAARITSPTAHSLDRVMVSATLISRRVQSCNRKGFTLIEIIVATAVFLVVVLILLQITSGMSKLWQSTSGTISEFQSARLAFSTITRGLSRATLHTYTDYIDTSVVTPLNNPFGNVRTAANASTFTVSSTTPTARASELHFVSGPSIKLLGQAGKSSVYPGHAVFFQAPLGYTNNSSYKTLNRTLNSVGFFVQYGAPPNLPTWLQPISATKYRFRLIQAIQPTENFDLYTKTATGSYNALSWLPLTTNSTLSTETASSYTSSVLAENVLLLIVRPRLDPQNEQILGTSTQLGPPLYSNNTQNSILCPDYNYDSRAWEYGYNQAPYSGTISRTFASPATLSRAQLMRNQVPPIVDIALVCADDASLARYQNPATPPAAVQVPGTIFTNSANLTADLATYGKQLTAAHIRYRLFRTSVNMQGASWNNN